MPPPVRPVDKDGFPIPPTFQTFQQTVEPARPRGKGPVWIVRALLFVVALGLVVGMGLKAVGPNFLVKGYCNRAEERYHNDDLAGAVADLDKAISWMPDAPGLYRQRAFYREKANDLSGSLEDYNRLIELRPNDANPSRGRSTMFPSAYTGRSTVYQRMERHREAIDDLNRAIQLRPKNDHWLLNHRAYTRAIANLELEEALVDIQQAIDMISYEEPAYLDTRGYVYYQLGRHEEALKDLDRAVQMAQQQRKGDLQAAAGRRVGQRERARREREFNEYEGVLIYHRGLVHEKLGNAEQAKADLDRGLQLGYNPAEGVY